MRSPPPYADAPRCVPATVAVDLLRDWTGPCEAQFYGRSWIGGKCEPSPEDGRGCATFANQVVLDARRTRLDPARPEVRDHLVRRLALPEWHRDTPGWLSAEESAGLVLGSALRVGAGLGAIVALLPVWHLAGGGEWDRSTTLHGCASLVVSLGMTAGWTLRCINRNAISGPEVGEAGKLAADASALANGLALRVPEGIVLPPLVPGGGPVLWRIQ